MEHQSNPALLIMDVQSAILKMIPEPEKFTEAVTTLLRTAREKKIPIFYVVVGFRNGMPEISPRNKSFSLSKDRLANTKMEDWMRIDPPLSPQEGEHVITKRRISAFTGSDLEVILRANNINHLVLCGISTSGVVLSTTREAADKDYQITILSDCCADADAEVHELLMKKVFPRQAEVIGLEAWIMKI